MIVNLCEIFQLKENTHYHRRHTSKVMAHPIHSVCNESESASYYSLRGRSFIRIPLKYYASITQKFTGIQDISILKYFETILFMIEQFSVELQRHTRVTFQSSYFAELLRVAPSDYCRLLFLYYPIL